MTTCEKCMHSAHLPGACTTPSTYGCRECGSQYVDCPVCDGSGSVVENHMTVARVARAHYESIFDDPEDVPWEKTGVSTKRHHASWAEEFLMVLRSLSEV